MATRHLTNLRAGLTTLAAATLAVLALAETQVAAPPAVALFSPTAFSGMPPGPVAAAWRVAGLPGQKSAVTQFDIVALAGPSVLRLQAQASYGNLVFATPRVAPAAGLMLHWNWRLDRGLEHSDLTAKSGDDTPLKVCALFDMPTDRLGMGERIRLGMARTISGEHLPSATLCYVWDRSLPTGSSLPNAFTDRLRYIVLSSGPARPGVWVHLERNLAADFLQAFGHETSSVAPLLALAVGADADNTGGSSLAFVGDISLAP